MHMARLFPRSCSGRSGIAHVAVGGSVLPFLWLDPASAAPTPCMDTTAMPILDLLCAAAFARAAQAENLEAAAKAAMAAPTASSALPLAGTGAGDPSSTPAGTIHGCIAHDIPISGTTPEGSGTQVPGSVSLISASQVCLGAQEADLAAATGDSVAGRSDEEPRKRGHQHRSLSRQPSQDWAGRRGTSRTKCPGRRRCAVSPSRNPRRCHEDHGECSEEELGEVCLTAGIDVVPAEGGTLVGAENGGSLAWKHRLSSRLCGLLRHGNGAARLHGGRLQAREGWVAGPVVCAALGVQRLHVLAVLERNERFLHVDHGGDDWWLACRRGHTVCPPPGVPPLPSQQPSLHDEA